jgi:hypothetical protein
MDRSPVHELSAERQLAHVQEKTNGMEPSRSAQYLLHVKTAIINGRLDRYTGIPGIIQYRRLSPPDRQVFVGLDLTAIDSNRGLFTIFSDALHYDVPAHVSS